MSHIVLVWELGGGFGHLARVQALVEPLLIDNHKITVVSRNLDSAHKVFSNPVITLIQAPLWNNRWPKNHTAISNAEILLLLGYGERQKFRFVLAAWQTLFQQLKPDLVIADYAPTAICAAKISSIPAIAMGNGFEIPPRGNPVASLQPWANIPPKLLLSLEQKVLGVVNEAFTDAGCNLIESYYELFRGDDNLLCTLQELDHFGDIHDLTYHGIYSKGISGDVPDWPEGQGAKIFLYLPASHPRLVQLVQAIRKLKLSAIFYIRGLPARARELMQCDQILVAEKPVNLPVLSTQADLVVSHGGHGTSASTLLAGSRLLTLPTNLEQRLLSYQLSQQGLVTTWLNDKAFNAEIALSIALGTPTVAEKVSKFADKYQRQTPEDVIAGLLQIVTKNL